MSSQERIKANKISRKHDVTWWGEKDRKSGASRASQLRSGGTTVATTLQDAIKANCETQIALGSGLMLITVPAGGAKVVPFDTVKIAGNALTLAASAIVAPYLATYYLGFSIRLFVPTVSGPIHVQAAIYKNGTLYQQIVDDWTPTALEVEQRYHAADYVDADAGDALEVYLTNPTAAPITYAVSDAYIDAGHGPRK